MILTAEQYKSFLGLEGQLAQDYDDLQELILKSFTAKQNYLFLDKLRISGATSQQYLSSSYGSQRYYTNYIGNKQLV